MKWMIAPAFAFGLAAAPITARADEAQDLWLAKCKSCHGEDGKAQTKVGKKEEIPDFTTAKWQEELLDGDIKRVIMDGSDTKPKMKPFKEKLSDAQINSLVKFIRTFKGK